VEVLNPLSFLFALVVATALIGWFFSKPFSIAAFGTKRRSIHAAIAAASRSSSQLGQVLDHSTQLIQQRLSQLLEHVNERLKENTEVLEKPPQTLADRLDMRLESSVVCQRVRVDWKKPMA
jgi:F0F1-type ATP synthase membrane subunit b/b'